MLKDKIEKEIDKKKLKSTHQTHDSNHKNRDNLIESKSKQIIKLYS